MMMMGSMKSTRIFQFSHTHTHTHTDRKYMANLIIIRGLKSLYMYDEKS